MQLGARGAERPVDQLRCNFARLPARIHGRCADLEGRLRGLGKTRQRIRALGRIARARGRIAPLPRAARQGMGAKRRNRRSPAGGRVAIFFGQLAMASVKSFAAD